MESPTLVLKPLFVILLVLLAGWCCARSFGGDRIVGEPFATRSPVIAKHGMVASAHPLASQIGLDILRQGGNAMDAAIAVNAALGLMEPSGCGVGGDLFAIIYSAKDDKVYGLNASGRSPRSVTLERMREELARGGYDKIPRYHGLAVSVPGTVSGWQAIHDRFGSLSMSEILAPSIAAAEEGVPLPQVIAYYFGLSTKRYKDKPEWLAVYARPDGSPYLEGDVFRNPLLAATYRRIAKEGADAFYTGPIAEAIEEICKKYGGFITKEDLSTHTADWVDPLGVDYRGHTLWELPPSGQGIAALQMLRLIEPFDIASMGHNSAEALHVLVEAKKIAYEDRARYYADLAFAPINLDRLISREYARERLVLFDSKTARKEIPPGTGILEDGDTTYLCVVDGERNMVSLIQSNYTGFGSGLVPKGTGFTLQNRGNLFSLEDDHPNRVEPGKRPFHTIIPAMVTREDGKPCFAYGVMGGAMQPQGHVQVLVNLLDFGMNVQEAGDAARFRHGGSSQPTDERMTDGGVLYLESGVSAEARAGLAERGHRIEATRGGFGGYQGIWVDWNKGILLGASESRKDGAAVGF